MGPSIVNIPYYVDYNTIMYIILLYYALIYKIKFVFDVSWFRSIESLRVNLNMFVVYFWMRTTFIVSVEFMLINSL